MVKRWGFVIMVLFFLISSEVNAGELATITLADIQHEIVISIPLGDKGIHYAGGSNPDMFIWGPPALDVAPDGSFWIADTPDNHLLQFDSEGVLIKKIDVSDFIIGAGDIEVTSNEIWVLDMASIPTKLVQLSLSGKVLSIHDLPKGLFPEDGLSGIAIGNDGSILLELEGGKIIKQFISPSGIEEQKALSGYPFHGDVIFAYSSDQPSDDSFHRYIQVGNKRIGVEFATNFGGVDILHANNDGSFWVVAEEVALNPAIQVDQKVYRYNADGNLDGMARIPIAKMYTSIAHGIVVGPDNNVYILFTKPDRAEIQRLSFVPKLTPILSSASNDKTNNLQVPAAPQSDCLSRSVIVQTASDYLNNSVYLDSYHITDPNNECGVRIKPRYLSTAGGYTSVSYAWDRWDTLQQYNNFMNSINNGKFSGNINQISASCASGVDCSGLVSIAWNLGDHYGTCTLENESTPIVSLAYLQRGDIMNRCSITPRHTIIFDHFNNDKSAMYGYEATTYLNYDRVVMIFRLFSSISDYIPRKYNNACEKIHMPIIQRNFPEKMGGDSDPYPPPPPPPPPYPYP